MSDITIEDHVVRRGDAWPRHRARERKRKRLRTSLTRRPSRTIPEPRPKEFTQ